MLAVRRFGKSGRTLLARSAVVASQLGSGQIRCGSGTFEKKLEPKEIKIREHAEKVRLQGIKFHPKSFVPQIIPGGVWCLRPAEGSMPDQEIRVERMFGSFWEMNNLGDCESKPILSNNELIPEKKARMFPSLEKLKVLSTNEVVEIPDHFLRKNRSKDPHAQCTLVAVSFKAIGAEHLDTWLEPFRKTFESNNRIEAFRLNITEGSALSSLLGWVILPSMKANIPKEHHDSTLVYLGEENVGFRDTGRMNNSLGGYVFLLDGLGRVRFAGSGPASDEEINRLIGFANELLPSDTSPIRKRVTRAG